MKGLRNVVLFICLLAGFMLTGCGESESVQDKQASSNQVSDVQPQSADIPMAEATKETTEAEADATPESETVGVTRIAFEKDGQWWTETIYDNTDTGVSIENGVVKIEYGNGHTKYISGNYVVEETQEVTK